MKIKFQGLGWKVKLQQKGRNNFLSIAKELIIGNYLNKGDELYYYLTEISGRRALVIMLDKDPIDNIMVK